MAKEQVDVFTVRRSHAVQGRDVEAYFDYNGTHVGRLTLPFAGWVKLKRLLENGVTYDQREGNALKVKVKVMGLEEEQAVAIVLPLKTPHPPETRYEVGQPQFQRVNTEGTVQVQDDDYDEDIAVAEQQAKHDIAVEQRAATSEQLVRSLRGES